jgi:hypothetical protein
MARSSLILVGLLVATTASAAPHIWSVTVPKGWTDVTEASEKLPAVQAMKQQIESKHGSVAFTFYQDEAGDTAFILDSTFTGASGALAVLTGFETGARGSFGDGHRETTYVQSRTPKLMVGTQRVMADDQLLMTKRFSGFVEGDKLRAIAITCTGGTAICDPIIDSLAVDTTGFRTLASLDDGTGMTPYQIGYLTGGLLVMCVGGYALVKARRRAQAR